MSFPKKYPFTVLFALIFVVVYQSMHMMNAYIKEYIPTNKDYSLEWVHNAHAFDNLDLSSRVPELKIHSDWAPFNESKDVSNGDWERSYHSFVKRRHIECEKSIRIGHEEDGGWDICVAGLYEPTDRNCLVYSFGISNDWSFDDEMGDIYGCQIRAFDPTLNYTKPIKRGEYISFYPVGLHDVDGEIQLLHYTKKLFPVRKFSTLLKELHDKKKVIDYVKIDIESSEWKVLPDMLRGERTLSQIKQLGIELHCPIGEQNINTFKSFVYILNELELAGFRKWLVHRNPQCMYKTREGSSETSCYEVQYINLNFLV